MVREKPSPKGQIEKLKSQAKLIGIDADALLVELEDRVAEKAAEKAAAKIDERAARIEENIGAKLEAVLEALKAKGQGEALSSQEVEAISKTTDVMLTAKVKEIVAGVKAELDERYKQVPSSLPPQETALVTTGGDNRGGGDIFGKLLMFVDRILQNPEQAVKIVELFRPPKGFEERVAEEASYRVAMSVRLARTFTDLQKGQGNIDDLQTNIYQLIAPPKKP